MKGSWWKILSVIILLYVLIMGAMTPLTPGIQAVYLEGAKQTNVTPVLKSGLNSGIHIQGYNSRFLSNSESLQIWLADSDTSTVISATSISALSEEELVFSIDVPAEAASLNLHVFVNNDADGTFWLDFGAYLDTATVQLKASEVALSFPIVKEEKCNYFGFPYRPILYESIRNLFLHVPMWFAMMFILLISLIKSIKFLRKGDLKDDWFAEDAAKVGLFFGLLGVATGSVWARYTWGDWWTNDIKLNGAAITVLIYMAYMVLRKAITDDQARGKVAAVYSIFAFCLMIVFIQIIPRTAGDSLHPGNAGNPAFSAYDLDNALRAFFYPAVIGWSMLAYWIYKYRTQTSLLREKVLDDEMA